MQTLRLNIMKSAGESVSYIFYTSLSLSSVFISTISSVIP